MVTKGKPKESYVWCRIPGTYMGRELDRGQVIPKLGSPRDSRLKDLGYLPDYELDGDLFDCPECGAQFMAMSWREGHVARRHKARAFPMPQRQDGESDQVYSERVLAWKEQQDEAEARRVEREVSVMPPHLENTLASTRG